MHDEAHALPIEEGATLRPNRLAEPKPVKGLRRLKLLIPGMALREIRLLQERTWEAERDRLRLLDQLGHNRHADRVEDAKLLSTISKRLGLR